MGNSMNDTSLRNNNIRKNLDNKLLQIKKDRNQFDVSELSKVYNSSRTTIGRLLSERGDVRRVKISQNYCSSVWEFI